MSGSSGHTLTKPFPSGWGLQEGFRVNFEGDSFTLFYGNESVARFMGALTTSEDVREAAERYLAERG